MSHKVAAHKWNTGLGSAARHYGKLCDLQAPRHFSDIRKQNFRVREKFHTEIPQQLEWNSGHCFTVLEITTPWAKRKASELWLQLCQQKKKVCPKENQFHHLCIIWKFYLNACMHFLNFTFKVQIIKGRCSFTTGITLTKGSNWR